MSPSKQALILKESSNSLTVCICIEESRDTFNRSEFEEMKSS